MRSTLEARRRKDPTFWIALNRVLTVLVFLGGGAIVVFWFYPELARRNEMAKNLDYLRNQTLASEMLLKKQRERELYLLENDREYIETIARDKLDLMKNGETIYRFDATRSQPTPKAE